MVITIIDIIRPQQDNSPQFTGENMIEVQSEDIRPSMVHYHLESDAPRGSLNGWVELYLVDVDEEAIKTQIREYLQGY